ncbi:hypothetical protein HMPREF1548_05885 [Clostridium sp. KLE 1755]|nr:hypothetical protein HMPREF1548_05885 [Clostridium sp. KLE 1755]
MLFSFGSGQPPWRNGCFLQRPLCLCIHNCTLNQAALPLFYSTK